MRPRTALLSASCLWLALAGCSRSRAAPTVMPDVDLAPLRSAFGCGASPVAPAHVEPCRVLSAFAAASEPVDPGASGLRAWLGAQLCAQPQSGGNYEILKLRPGRAALSEVRALGATEPDAAPFTLSNPTANAQAPDIIASYARLLDSLTAGQPPALDANLAGAFDPRRVTEGEPFFPVLRTAGPSVYVGNPRSLSIALRAQGTRLLLVRPSMAGGCVSELYRL